MATTRFHSPSPQIRVWRVAVIININIPTFTAQRGEQHLRTWTVSLHSRLQSKRSYIHNYRLRGSHTTNSLVPNKK